jgi:hypothetical protein
MREKGCSTCGACHFGPVPGQRNIKGWQCRRRPPQIVVLPAQGALTGQVTINVTALWPVVNLDDDVFCCDWIERSAALLGAPDAGLN